MGRGIPERCQSTKAAKDLGIIASSQGMEFHIITSTGPQYRELNKGLDNSSKCFHVHIVVDAITPATVGTSLAHVSGVMVSGHKVRNCPVKTRAALLALVPRPPQPMQPMGQALPAPIKN